MYRKKMTGWLKHWDFILLDLICLHLSFVLACGFRLGNWFPYQDNNYMVLSVMMTIFSLLDFACFNTLSNVLRRGPWGEFSQTIRHTVIVLAAISLYMFSLQSGETYSRIAVYLTAGVYFFISYLFRLLYKNIVRHNHISRSMYVVSDSTRIKETLNHLKEDGTFHDIEICGAAVLDQPFEEAVESVQVQFLDISELLKRISQEWVDEVFVDLPDTQPELNELKQKIVEMGIVLHVPVIARTGNHVDQLVENIGGFTVLTSSIRSASTIELVLKRCLDLLGGLIGCLFTLLICLFVGPIIKHQSPGPLFFAQERIGLNGKRFKMYKIRSMVMNADALKKDLMKLNRVSDGMMFKLDWDPRIIGNKELPDGTRKTGIGEFIRKTSLDEFPQFFNVLKGDMSLVGTRPPTVDEWEKYDLHHRARMATKPGITGMWQVSGRSSITDFEEVVRLDTEYIANWTLGLDIKILLKTVKSVLKHDGAM